MVKDWTGVKKDIERLYHVENKPLSEVMRLIKGLHGFHASERSYRTQLQKWKLLKYNTEANPRVRNVAKARSAGTRRQSNVQPLSQSANAPSASVDSNSHVTFEPNVSNFPLDNINHQQWNFETELPIDGATSSNSNIQYDQSIRNEGVAPVQYAFGLDDVDESGRTALYRAIHNKDINQVQSLLGKGAAVDIRDNYGNQALHYAVDSKDLRLVKLLLRYGADINAAGNRGYSPLHLAIFISDADVATLLVDEGASIASQDHNGDSALHLAVIGESWNLAEFQGRAHQVYSAPLVNILTAAKADMNIPNAQGSTPFHKLLNSSSELNAKAVYTYITKFIESGASVHLPLRNGLSPFEVFLAKSKFPWDETSLVKSAKNIALRTFVEHGADPATPLPSREPLILHFISNCLKDLSRTWGSKWEDFTLLDLLCSNFRNSPIKENGNTTLHQLALACGERTTSKRARIREAMETLLNKGEDPNRQNSDGETPLLLLFTGINTSVSKKRIKPVLQCLKTLLAHGADSMILNSYGNSGLFEAAKNLNSNELSSVLKADRERKDSISPEHRSQPSGPSRFIWSDWEQAIREEHWEDAKMHVLAPSANIPSEIAKKLRDSAFKVLAGRHIDLAKTLFQGESDATEKRRKLVATILRDCQLQNVELEVTWMNFLLTLC